MKTSLKEFNKDINNLILDIHWKQWGCLGIGSRLEEEKGWIIDLEALLGSTIFMGQFDKRLFSSALEWVYEYGDWINVSRLKRIGAYYYKDDDKLNVLLASKNIYELVENIIKKKRKVNDPKQIQEQVEQYNLPDVYHQVLEKFQVRRVTTEPEVQKPPLQQLLLRGFFGINARAEILLYLLNEKEGSSNQIAKTVKFDQKIVYRILEKWTEAGFIDKESGRKYFLSNPNLFSVLLKRTDDSVNYLDWIDTFHVMARVMKAIQTGPWESDAYLLSSFFRHISKDLKRIARSVDVFISESNLFKGKEYLSPFIKDVTNILKKLQVNDLNRI
jgi:predicted transcriptional regulator